MHSCWFYFMYNESWTITISLIHLPHSQIFVSSITMAMAACSMVSGWFGMNLANGWCGPEGCSEYVLSFFFFLLVPTVQLSIFCSHNISFFVVLQRLWYTARSRVHRIRYHHWSQYWRFIHFLCCYLLLRLQIHKEWKIDIPYSSLIDTLYPEPIYKRNA